MGRQFLENNIVGLIILFAIGVVAAIGFTQWNAAYTSAQIQDFIAYIQAEQKFNQGNGFNYGTGSFYPVALATEANPALVSGSASQPVIASQWNTPLTWTGTGSAFQIGATGVPAADCIGILSSSALAPFVSSIQVTGKGAETALPLSGDAAAADCQGTDVAMTLTAKGRPGS